ncbi:hypothetical protein TrST_g7313 [Triparma strigata]|uniref:Uncharacterized protein n=1 Tax=Triparma strigata TaxID=1606541 RepID=A0A9W7BMP0_9STRA|nr:hypothetical protein TrST_g7313 [Triparma strigata]
MPTAASTPFAMPAPPTPLTQQSVQYQELLSTISELQLDLQRTVGLASKLKNENAGVRKNYEEIKSALVRTRQRYSDTRTALLEQMEASAQKESSIESAITKWKSQLDGRTKELEALQAKLAPQDLDLLRIKLQEELETTHAARLSAIDGEVDKWRQMFFKVRREYELCRTEYEQFTVNSSNDIEAAHEQRRAEVASLQRALVKATKNDGKDVNQALSEEVQKLERRLSEQAVIEEDLRREVVEVRAEKEKEELARHEFVSSFQAELAEQHSRLAQLEADKDALTRSVASLNSENSRLKAATKEAQILCDSAQAESVRARKILTDREKDLIDEKAKTQSEVAKSRRIFELEREELQNSIDALRRAKAEAEEHSMSLGTELQNAKRAVVTGEDKARREAREQLTILQQQIEKLENENLRLEDAKKRLAVEHASNVSRLSRECEAARSDCQRIAREKEALAARSAGLADKQEMYKSSASESEEEKARLERQAKEYKSKARSLEKELADAKVANADLTRRLENTNADVSRLSNALDKTREEHLVAITDLKKTIQKDREVLKEKLKQEVAKYKSKLAKEQRKSAAYKEKAMEAHQKGQRARNALSSVASANEMYGGGTGAA